MSKTKKVVLFIVEGKSEEASFDGILSKLVDNAEVKFQLIHGDLTTKKNASPGTILRDINKEVTDFLDKTRLKRSDLSRIIHLVDMDGCFISDQFISTGSVVETQYTLSEIITSNTDGIKKRNEQKSAILRCLSTTHSQSGTPYSVFYFSCNLEHVLHNILATLSDAEKKTLSDTFSDRFWDNSEDFIEFISDPLYAVPGEYTDTWQFIAQNKNSLNRYCNFHLFFKSKFS